MASITLSANSQNIALAVAVQLATGAEFREEDDRITIEAEGRLQIPRSCFESVYNPDGLTDSKKLDEVWRALVLNRSGNAEVTPKLITITDEVEAEKRPTFLLRFNSAEQKSAAEEWAGRAGFNSLTNYILAAIDAFNDSWKKRSDL